MSSQITVKRGGKKARKMKKRSENTECHVTIKEEGQEYAYVEKILGGHRFSVRCFDSKQRLAHLRGSLTRGINKAIITNGAHVLISLRDYQDAKCDIIQLYNNDEVAKLKSLGELPVNDNMCNFEENDDIPFDFTDI